MAEPCLPHINNPCKSFTNTDCIVYTGPNLPVIGIVTNDRLTAILNKLETQLGYFESGGVLTFNGRTGNVVPILGDYTTTIVAEGTNLYYNNARVLAYGDTQWVRLDGSYSNPTWLTSLPWSKVTGTPTTLAGYGITDAQPLITGNGIVVSTAGTISYITNNSTNWNTAYNKYLTGVAVTGTSTKTLTLTQQDGSTLVASWSDLASLITLTAGTGISILGANPNFTVVNTAPDQVVSLTAGVGITVTGTYPNFTLSTSASGGTVTSVDMTVPTGLVVSGNPITVAGTLALTFDTGYSIPTNTNQSNWTTAYNDSIVSAAVTGTSTKTLTLTQQDGGTLTASWSDLTSAVISVFGRTGAVVATLGDYNTDLVTEGITNVYFTAARARLAISAGTGISYDNLTGIVTNSAPDKTVVLTSGTGISATGTYPNFTITNTAPDQVVSLSNGTGISITGTYPNFTIATTITQYTDALARLAISETITGIDYDNLTGVFSLTTGYVIPTTTDETNWNSAYTNRITSLTVTGNSGVATLISNTLNIPTYTFDGLNPMTTAGDIIYGGVAGVGTRLGIGGANTVLHGGASAPSWSAVVEADISLSNNVTNNVSTTRHGFVPVLPNNGTLYFDGQGNYTTPAGLSVNNSYKQVGFSGTSINVIHGWGAYPVVQVIDSTGAVLIPMSIVNNTLNDFTVTFSSAHTGTIIATVGGPQPNAVSIITGAYTVLTTDMIVKVTTAAVTITLPTSVGNTGRIYYINNASGGVIFLIGTSSQTISGLITQSIPAGSTLQVYADGTNYQII